MKFKRITISEKSTYKCRTLKNKTGLTPNIICRIAFTLSLSEKNIPSLDLYYEESGQEINRYTFLGEYELLLLALYLQWCIDNSITQKDYYQYLIAHLNRGVELISNRVKGLEDFVNLIDNKVAYE